MHGDAPPGAQRIADRAASWWPHLAVDVEWTRETMSGCEPGQPYAAGVGGCTYVGNCGILGWEECIQSVVVYAEPVEASALAHELCHASHSVSSEIEAAACAAALNAIP